MAEIMRPCFASQIGEHAVEIEEADHALLARNDALGVARIERRTEFGQRLDVVP